jgi:hypothetical protein
MISTRLSFIVSVDERVNRSEAIADPFEHRGSASGDISTLKTRAAKTHPSAFEAFGNGLFFCALQELDLAHLTQIEAQGVVRAAGVVFLGGRRGFFSGKFFCGRFGDAGERVHGEFIPFVFVLIVVGIFFGIAFFFRLAEKFVVVRLILLVGFGRPKFHHPTHGPQSWFPAWRLAKRLKYSLPSPTGEQQTTTR